MRKVIALGLVSLLVAVGCVPRPPAALPVQVALGEYHSCVLMSDGSVRCWGYNGLGQLENGTTVDSNVPVTAGGIAGVHALVAAVFHNCGLFTGGVARCWYPLADGVFGTTTRRTGIATGNAHTCEIMAAGGSVTCGGSNNVGQLGDGTYSFSLGTTVVGLAGVTALAAGFNSSCALVAGGAVRCWGEGTDGQLGNGANATSNVPVPVAGLTGATAISAYGGSACALMAGGTVECWGRNADGQLGNGTTTGSNVPVAVTGITGATAISEGGDHGCAIVAGGTVKCWGRNSNGQLGNGTNTSSNVPVAVTGIP